MYLVVLVPDGVDRAYLLGLFPTIEEARSSIAEESESSAAPDVGMTVDGDVLVVAGNLNEIEVWQTPGFDLYGIYTAKKENE